MTDSSNKTSAPAVQWLPTTIAAVTWGFYVSILLLSDFPPGESLLQVRLSTLQEALNLSFNFWFVMPLLLPGAAPELNPILEAMFNLVVAWGLLFWGFLLDGRRQFLPMLPFLIGTAFLTNVFYLPWLVLRSPNPAPPELPLRPLERFVERRILPLGMLLVAIAAMLWAVWGRPELGDWATRWVAWRDLLARDRLAVSFLVDLIMFGLFQGWLVADDMARRQWRHPWALWGARLVPFIGLVAYLLLRPQIAATLRDRAE